MHVAGRREGSDASLDRDPERVPTLSPRSPTGWWARSPRHPPNGRTRPRAADGRRDRRRACSPPRSRRLRWAVAAFMNSGGVRSDLSSTKSRATRPTGRSRTGRYFHRPAVRQHARRQDGAPASRSTTCEAAVEQSVRGKQSHHAPRRRTSLPAERSTRRPDIVDGTLTLDDGATRQGGDLPGRAQNNFTANGGDGYTVFRSCTEPLGGDVDIDAFVEYLGKTWPLAPWC